MINRKSLIGIFSIFYITIIYSEDQGILWDFGFKIISENNYKPKQHINNSDYYDTDALIANRFIAPDYQLTDEPEKNKLFIESINKVFIRNLSELEILAAKFSINNNYQSIINMLNQIDLSLIDYNNYFNIYYWLANAYFQLGKYIEAENILLTENMYKMHDYSFFLLAKNYENKGEIKNAIEKYKKFSKTFPKSNLNSSALMKITILQ
tara:strand:- start:300 stop:926 length:627 start_codon:yes stop_codon:yes gene_type:complete